MNELLNNETMRSELIKAQKQVLKALIDNGIYNFTIVNVDVDEIMIIANYTDILVQYMETPYGANKYCINIYFTNANVDMQTSYVNYKSLVSDVKEYV